MSEEGPESRCEVGGYEACLRLDEPVTSQGDRVQGSLSLIPLEQREAPERVDLVLREVWVETGEGPAGPTSTLRERVHQRETLREHELRTVVQRSANGFQLERARAFPFALDLPRNARPSTSHAGWQLVVEPQQRGEPVFPAQARIPLEVQPAEEFQALLSALTARMRFRELREERRWDSQTLTSCFVLEPPRALQDDLDRLELELVQQEQGLEATLIFDKQEQGSLDYFRALLSLDRVKRTLHLTREQVFLPDGSPRHSDLVRALVAPLREVLEG